MVLDELGKTDPHRVYAAIPKTSNVADGFRDVSVADLVRCVDFMAKWLEDKFGRSNSFETITYIGLSDVRSPAILLAAIKTGYKLLLPSPRNPPSTNLSLMNQTGSTKVLYAAELAPLVKSLQSVAPSVSTDAIPSFQEMLESNPEPYPYEKSFEEARGDPIVVLHSSGSTGLPKPIIWTHGTLAAHDNDHNLHVPAGRGHMDSTVFDVDGEARLYVMLPFFHLGGFIFYIDHAILNSISLVLGPPLVPPDAALFKDVARQLKLRGIMTVPAVLEELLHDATGMKLLGDLDFVACAGAPLPTAVGDQIKNLVRLFIFIGSTETLPLPELSKSPEDWQYHEFNPNFKHEMQLFDPHIGTYELVIFADESNKDMAPLYHSLPGVNPYHTKDLFSKHPKNPHLFKYYGRKDDILVLDNGEKVNPIPLEQYVQGHPAVKGALVVGSGRFQLALLVEPREPLDAAGRADFLEMLWPRIEEANAHVPGQGRIIRDRVICALPDKPFIRAGKGTIIRKATEGIYSDEIEARYSNTSSRDQDQILSIRLEPTLKTIYEPAKIVGFLRQILAVSFGPAATVGENEDLFAHGLDSLQTLGIVSNLKHSLKALTSSPVTWIVPRIIFRNSTIADLSNLLARFLNDGIVPDENSGAYLSTIVDETVARHTEHLPTKRKTSLRAPSVDTQTIALIGSTGYLGSYLVAALLRDPKVSRVYCLNRSRDARERQNKALDNLDEALRPFFHKLIYLEVELGQPLLGLSQEKYDLVSSEVDVVVYNSWRLDFGLAIRSFEPFLKATRDLVDLSATGKRNMRVVFISSIASVEELARKTTVPEAPVEDSLASINIGYGQSKLAAEQILVTANRLSGIPVSVIRVGQVGGPSQNVGGTWADQPWVSALIRTSKTLGYFPSPLAPIDWVAVDTVADMLRGISLQPAKEEPQIYNITTASDNAQPWDLLLEAVRELTGMPEMEVISLRDWVKKLRDIPDPSPEDVAKLPALKLLDFYDIIGSGTGRPAYATGRAEEVSGVKIPAVDKELLVSWLKSWNL